MKKFIKSIIILILGVCLGYYICNINLSNLFNTNYKAFQVGVYTSVDVANMYKSKYDNAIVIKDDEDNIESMSNYLNSKGIDYYLKDLDISDKNLKKVINEYESIMNSNNEIVFLEVNKMIMEKYEESL